MKHSSLPLLPARHATPRESAKRREQKSLDIVNNTIYTSFFLFHAKYKSSFRYTIVKPCFV